MSLVRHEAAATTVQKSTNFLTCVRRLLLMVTSAMPEQFLSVRGWRECKELWSRARVCRRDREERACWKFP